MSEREKNDQISPRQNQDSYPPVSHPDLTEELGTQIGPYKLLSVLGEGGFGIVYLAEQKKPVRRQVALKVIKPGMDSKQVLARFESEEQALALLDHPNIAHVFDAGTTERGRPYFAMEYVKGKPVTEHCDQEKLTIKERLQLFLQVCDAIRYSHQKGIIHRDIKPSNILVSVQSRKAIPIIIDFGVAKALSQPLTERTLFTEQGQLIGTPEYMSPEQAEMTNQDIDTRTDIYSLGVLLYVLLTGILPFDSQTLRKAGIEHIRHMIREEDPKTPSTRLGNASVEESANVAQQRQTDIRSLKNELRGDLDWITMKAMEKDRNRRYETAHALAEDIQRHLNREPVHAVPPSTLYRLRKLCRKHQSRLVAALMAVLLLASMIITGVIYYRSHSDRIRKVRIAHENKLRAIESLLYKVAPVKPHIVQRGGQGISTLPALSGQDSQFEASQQLLTTEEKKSVDSGIDDHRHTLTDILDMTDELLNSKHVGPRAALLRAVILLKLRDYDAAKKVLKDLPEIEDVACSACFLLARAYGEDPNGSEEDQQIAEALEKEADQLLTESKDPEAFYYRAMGAETLEETLDMLNSALDIERGHYPSLIARAWTYDVLNEYDKMKLDAYVLTVIHKDNPVSFALHAIALRQLGEYTLAIKDHDKAIDMADMNDPRYADLYFERYQTCVLDHQYDQACQDAEEWIKRFEERPEKYGYDFGSFSRKVMAGDYDGARAKYHEMVSMGSSNKQLLQKKADFRDKCEKYVFDVLGAGQEWKPLDNNEPAFWPMQEAADYYRYLTEKGARKVVRGFKATWSPTDDNKLVYTRVIPLPLGRIRTSHNGIEIRDLESGKTQLLAVPGKDPAWSPDGEYIAFVRQPLEISTSSVSQDEIWIMKPNGNGARFVAKGGFPSWSPDSKRIYFQSRESSYLCSISIEEEKTPVKEHVPCKSYYPSVSPDGKYVAYRVGFKSGRCELRIVEISGLRQGSIVATWKNPPYERGMLTYWSPDGRELSIGGYDNSDFGLWIYDMETQTASKALNGPVTQGVWSPKRNRMVFDLRFPFYEIWTVDLAPDVSTAKALGSSQNVQQHLKQLYDKYQHVIDSNALDSNNKSFIYNLDRNLGLMFSEQYRKKEYADALRNLIRMKNLRLALYNGIHIYFWYYTFELNHRIGNTAQAKACILKLRAECRESGSQNNLNYLIRAEKLLRGTKSKVSAVWQHIEKQELEEAAAFLAKLKKELSDNDYDLSEFAENASAVVASAFVHRSLSHERLREYSKALSDLKSAVAIDPNHALAYNNLAWLQATCPLVEIRDGSKAVQNATHACRLTQWKKSDFLDSLAAAHAESGNFDRAVEIQKDAKRKLPEDMSTEMRNSYEDRLKLYMQHTPYHRQLLPSHLIAHYTFDKVKGDTVLDSSSYGIDGTLQGDAQIIEDSARGKVLKLDGNGDWVDCGNNVIFNITEMITVSVWIKVNKFDKAWQAIVTKGDFAWRLQRRGKTNSIEFSCTGTRVESQDTSTGYLFGNNNVNDGKWHHLVGVYDGTQITLFVDSKRDASLGASGRIRTDGYRVLIGANSNRLSSQPRHWNGLIDDVRIYSYALSEAEVKELYESYNPGS
jgi:serine/threonine protein kinase